MPTRGRRGGRQQGKQTSSGRKAGRPPNEAREMEMKDGGQDRDAGKVREGESQAGRQGSKGGMGVRVRVRAWNV